MVPGRVGQGERPNPRSHQWERGPALQPSTNRAFRSVAVSGHRGGKVRWSLEHAWPNIKDSKCHARGDNDSPGTPAERLLFRREAHYQEMTSGYPGNRAPGPRAWLWLSLVPRALAVAPAAHQPRQLTASGSARPRCDIQLASPEPSCLLGPYNPGICLSFRSKPLPSPPRRPSAF